MSCFFQPALPPLRDDDGRKMGSTVFFPRQIRIEYDVDPKSQPTVKESDDKKKL